MPLAGFVPSRIHLDYPEWQAPLIGNVGQVWAYDGTGYVPTTFLPASAVSVYGLTLASAADAAAARTALALGTAALYNVGTGASNVVQLDGSARLPAVDGSQLTGISGGSVAGSNTQVIYNAAGVYAGDAGLTYNASTDRLTVSGGLVAPSMRPASDSATALQWQKADGTPFVYGDTTNGRFSVGGSGITATFGIKSAGNNVLTTAFLIRNSDSDTIFRVYDSGVTQQGSSAASQQRYEIYSLDRSDFRMYHGGNTSNYLGFYAYGGAAGSGYGEFGFLNVGTAQGASINFDTRTGIAPYRFFVKPSGGSSVNAMDIFATTAVQIGTNNSEIASTRFAVKSAGATSSTFAAKFVNSASANLMSIRDDGYVDVGGTVQADGLRLDITPTSETITPTHTITISLNGTNYKISCVAA